MKTRNAIIAGLTAGAVGAGSAALVEAALPNMQDIPPVTTTQEPASAGLEASPVGAKPTQEKAPGYDNQSETYNLGNVTVGEINRAAVDIVGGGPSSGEIVSGSLSHAAIQRGFDEAGAEKQNGIDVIKSLERLESSAIEKTVSNIAELDRRAQAGQGGLSLENGAVNRDIDGVKGTNAHQTNVKYNGRIIVTIHWQTTDGKIHTMNDKEGPAVSEGQVVSFNELRESGAVIGLDVVNDDGRNDVETLSNNYTTGWKLEWQITSLNYQVSELLESLGTGINLNELQNRSGAASTALGLEISTGYYLEFTGKGVEVKQKPSEDRPPVVE